MHVADDPSAPYIAHDIFNRSERLRCVRLIVHRQKYARHDLQHEHKGGKRAEVVPEVEVLGRDVLAPLLLPQADEREACVDPRQHAVQRAGAGYGAFVESGHRYAPFVSSPMTILVSPTNVYFGTSRFLGAGDPAKTRPAKSNLEPWHGQKNPPFQS